MRGIFENGVLRVVALTDEEKEAARIATRKEAVEQSSAQEALDKAVRYKQRLDELAAKIDADPSILDRIK